MEKITIDDIQTWNNSHVVEYYINCFERTMIIIFKDSADFNENEIDKELENLYINWHDDKTGIWECCEEYMLTRLSNKYKKDIMAVLYEYEEEEE